MFKAALLSTARPSIQAPHSSRPDEPFLSHMPEFLRDCGLPAKTRLSSHWTNAGGLRLHSREAAGAGGIPFLLIHGLVISSLYMIPLAECLAVHHSVHALDLPGFGRSQGRANALTISELARAVVEWMDARGIEKCHLVANSLGCQISAHVAAEFPSRVVSLTLIGATVDPAAPGVALQIFRLLKDALREPPRLWSSWLVDFMRAGLGRTLGTVRSMFKDHIEKVLPLIKAPALVIRGENDPTMPMRWAQEAAELIANGRVLVIPGEAHCAHYSAPKAVMTAILAHARTASGK